MEHIKKTRQAQHWWIGFITIDGKPKPIMVPCTIEYVGDELEAREEAAERNILKGESMPLGHWTAFKKGGGQ